MNRLKENFRRGTPYVPFLLCVAALALAYGLYKGVIDNFLAEVVTMGEFDRGVAEFFRELPGLALIFILAALYMHIIVLLSLIRPLSHISTSVFSG